MESDLHLLAMLSMIGSLRHLYRRKKTVFIGGNMFLFYREGHPNARKAPDIMVAKGAEPKENRKSYKIWEEKTVPGFIMEFTSRETAQEDLGPKKVLYQSLAVREYFLFDPAGEWLTEQLMGFRLMGDEYQDVLPEKGGGLLSLELGLRLVPEGSRLALYQHKTGKKILAPDDAYLRLEHLEKKLAKTQAELKRLRKRQP